MRVIDFLRPDGHERPDAPTRHGLVVAATAVMSCCLHRKYRLLSALPRAHPLDEVRRDFRGIWTEFLAEFVHHTDSVVQIREFCAGGNTDDCGERVLDAAGISRFIEDAAYSWYPVDGAALSIEDAVHLRSARIDIAGALGVGVSNIEDFLHRGERFWTVPMLKALVAGLFLRDLLKRSEGIGSDSPETMLHYFPLQGHGSAFYDCVVQLLHPASDTPYLCMAKLVNVGATGADIVDRAVRHLLAEQNESKFGVLVFVPYFPEADCQRAVQYWDERLQHGLHALYLDSYYEIFRAESAKGVVDYLAQYLLG
jgi:hypothetical protein